MKVSVGGALYYPFKSAGGMKTSQPPRDVTDSDLYALVLKYGLQNTWKAIAANVFGPRLKSEKLGVRGAGRLVTLANKLKKQYKRSTWPYSRTLPPPPFPSVDDAVLQDLIQLHGLDWTFIGKEFAPELFLRLCYEVEDEIRCLGLAICS